MSPEVMSNFMTALKIMGQGMVGIFVVVVLITLVVLALQKLK